MKLANLQDNKKVIKALIKLNKEISQQEKFKNESASKSLGVMTSAFGVGTVAYMANMGTLSNVVSIACLFGGVLAGIFICNEINNMKTEDAVKVMNSCGIECNAESKDNFEKVLYDYKEKYEDLLSNKKIIVDKKQKEKLMKNYANQISELCL